jgi:hypothetical protein
MATEVPNFWTELVILPKSVVDRVDGGGWFRSKLGFPACFDQMTQVVVDVGDWGQI